MALGLSGGQPSVVEFETRDVQANDELGAVGGDEQRNGGICLQLAQNLMSDVGGPVVEPNVGVVEKEIVGPYRKGTGNAQALAVTKGQVRGQGLKVALFNLGRLCADKKKYMDAKGFYERLVEITPDDPMAWYNLAGVYVELDNPQVSDYNTIDAAIQCYLRTLELDPKHLEGSFKLMELALNHKKSDLAIKVMEDAVEHNADEPLAYYNLISVYDKCKMFEQAEQARQRLKERFAKRSKTSAS